MATTTQPPPQQRRPSVTQRLSSLLPGRRSSQSQSQPQPQAQPQVQQSGVGGAQPATRLAKDKQKEKDGQGGGFEGGEGLARTVSPLEQGDAHLRQYQPAAALSVYSAALLECATPDSSRPPSPTHNNPQPADPSAASTSTSAPLPLPPSAPSPSLIAPLSTSPNGTAFIPTASQKLELELKHALCRLKVGHCAEALAGARKVIAKVDAKEATGGGTAGLTADEVGWRKKARWIEETATEGKQFDGGQIPAR